MTTVPQPRFPGSEELFAEVKANAERLAACKRHRVELGNPPYKFGMTVTCIGCGGNMKAVDLFRYVQGFEAAGGNPNDVVPGYNPEWKASALDTPTPEQGRMLAQALGECLIASGIVRKDVSLSGPELLMFAEDLKASFATNEEQAEGVLQRQHSNVKEAHDRIYDLLLGDDPQAIKEGRAYLQREAPELAAKLAVVNPEKTFEDAWQLFEAAGFRYGGDALEQVRFGWQIAHGRKP